MSFAGSGTTVDAGSDIKITGPSKSSAGLYPGTASGTSWASPTRGGANDGSYATYSFGGSGTSGQKYRDTTTATHFELDLGQQTG
jgi:hypothetical protein